MNLTEDTIRKRTCAISFLSTESKETDRKHMNDGILPYLSVLKD